MRQRPRWHKSGGLCVVFVTWETVMRHVLAGLSLLAAATATVAPAAAHDRYPYYYAPPPRYVVPAPRYYYPPPAYYYAPAPAYVYPHSPRHHRPYYGYRPYHHRPQGSATFFFKF
jgi:hypothetical protein